MYLKEQTVFEGTAVWANSASANTAKTATLTKPLNPLSEYEIIVYNPSTESDLTCKVYNTELALDGDSRDALLTTLSFPKTVATIRLVHGLFNGCNGKLIFTNDTVIGGSGGFTATYRIREV